MSFLSLLVVALGATIFIEFFVYLAFICKKPIELLLFSILINSFTNPILNYFYNFEFYELYGLEILVTLIEGILIMLLMEIRYYRAMFISLAANLTSLLIGIIVFG